MKKLFALMLLLAALVVTGCGEGDTTDSTPATPDATEPADTDGTEGAPAEDAPADGTNP